jgi:hypothetical protein
MGCRAFLFVLLAFVAITVPFSAANATEDAFPYIIRSDHWSSDDEKGYRDFIKAIGESDCDTLDSCLHGDANPFRGTDAPGHRFASDCADLPYVLRFYYAWKRGLPFSYVSQVEPRGTPGDDLRYSRNGNAVAARRDVPSGTLSGYAIIDHIRADISSATYRIHPDIDAPVPDFYSPALRPGAIQTGTVVYDPAGHVAIVYRVDPDGRIHLFDAHTDFSLTQMVYDLRFIRVRPANGAGFKNWRPVRLTGATRMADGSLRGGHMELARNAAIADFSDEQYYGNGTRPADEAWAKGTFTLNKEQLDYYDYVRARLAGDPLVFDPVKEIGEMASSLCSDLHYRESAVNLAIFAGMADKPEPPRLPRNIYGTSGDWEIYSTPSRDARLKTAFKALRDAARRFIEMHKTGDTTHLNYTGTDIAGDMLAAYDRATQFCRVSYRHSDGQFTAMSFEQARQRLFAMSFDPYQCIERRWGATDPVELAYCRDDATKQAWYAAEQPLRNQTERTYDSRMDYTLSDLQRPGIGVAYAPDTDIRTYLTDAKRP